MGISDIYMVFLLHEFSSGISGSLLHWQKMGIVDIYMVFLLNEFSSGLLDYNFDALRMGNVGI